MTMAWFAGAGHGVDGAVRAGRARVCRAFRRDEHGWRPVSRTGRASALLDVARDCFVDAFVGRYSEDDRSLAQHHLPVLVMDRGYPSRDLFAHLVRQGVKFCARLSNSWSVTKRVLRAGLADQIHEMGTSDAPLPQRILCHALPNGTVLKARLQVENWSGVLPHTVEQDFYAALVCANCAAALALEADPKHASVSARA